MWGLEVKKKTSLRLSRRAQSIVEYTIIIGIVTMAMVTMNAYFKRGIQGMLKKNAQDIGAPAEEMCGESYDRDDLSAQAIGTISAGLVKYEVINAPQTTVESNSTIQLKADGERWLLPSYSDERETTGLDGNPAQWKAFFLNNPEERMAE
jgi:Flp pilus assembly pilin Flp